MQRLELVCRLERRSNTRKVSLGRPEGTVCDSSVFSGTWEGGGLQVKVKASGTENTVYWRKEKVQKPPWGKRRRWEPALKMLLCGPSSRRSAHRASEASELRLRLHDRALCS